MTVTTGYIEPAFPMVSWFTPRWGGAAYTNSNAFPASGTYEVANQACYYPIFIPTGCVARRMWWANGATVSATYNVEAGIYLNAAHKPGAKLITTGSVAQGTLNQVQFADITDTVLTPGLYWLYFSCSSTSATFFRTQGFASSSWDEAVKFIQGSVGPGSAPSTATPAEPSATSRFYLTGFSTTTIT